jgi:hypothetical protein
MRQSPSQCPHLHPVFDLGEPISDHRHSAEPATAFQARDPASAPPAPPFGRTGYIGSGIIDRLLDRLGTQMTLGLASKPHRQFIGYT